MKKFFHRKLSSLFVWVSCVLGSCLYGQIDDNSNGLSDVWEAAHTAGLVANADPDDDGFTNQEEAVSGTDPQNTEDFPRVRELISTPANGFSQVWQTVAGVRYQPMVSSDLTSWKLVGPALIGTGELLRHELPASTIISAGGIRRTLWSYNHSGLSTAKNYALLQSPPAPLIDDTLSRLEIPPSNPDVNQFCQWLRGWIIAPETGDYTFWIASDDESEFWLSTNDQSSGKILRCSVSGWANVNEWTRYPSQQSAIVRLNAGQAYYFDIFHAEGWGGDHIAIAWTRPSMATNQREIISGNALSSSPDTLGNIAANGTKLFFRLDINHTDSDSDGLSDYEEHLLGLDALNPTTTPRLADATAGRRSLSSASVVTLGVSAPRAYESGSSPARFIAFRSGGISPLDVSYTVSGTAVSGSDFQPLPGTIHFPAGVRVVPISVIPLNDGLLEAQEMVTLTLQSGSGYELASPASTSIKIDDAADVLYVAQLRSAPGLQSAGKGFASVRNAGNSLSSRVALSFGGLGSAQITAEIFHSTNQGLGGPTVFSFPQGQVSAMDWNINANGGMSREQILQALADGQLWVRVASTTNTTVEILGQLLVTPAWQTMPPVESVPASPTHANSIAEAARFLTQATYGPTETSLSSLNGNAYSTWVDAQIAMPSTHHRPAVNARAAQLLARGDESAGWQGPRNETWWQRSLTAPDQLRQRMAFALSQIFVISQFGALDSYHEGVTIYYDMLLEQSFGNYRELLEKVTLSPMMGTYLSMIRNRKPDPTTGQEPDENYAREIMQLFSVGLSMTHLDGSLKLDEEGIPIPTYTQEETVSLAHIFTGWGAHYSDTDPPRWSPDVVATRNDWFLYGFDELREMSFYPDFHDTKQRTILGGHIIPAGTDGRARLEQALDAIFLHPNTAPFIAKQLIQKFVTSNPSPGYVARVARAFENNGSGIRGDLGATIKAVLLDYEARAIAPRQSYSFGKPSEPLLRIARSLRVLPGNLPKPADPNYFINLQWTLTEQAPLLSTSVFNFYQPGYANPGPVARAGLLSPEFQIFGETNALRQANFQFDILSWGIWTSENIPSTDENYSFTINYEPLVAILDTPNVTPAQAQALLINHLDERFLFGQMSSALRAQITASFAALPTWFNFTAERQEQRAQVALYLVLNSPEFFVLK